MATFAPTISRIGDLYHATVKWTLTGAGTGNAVAMPGYRLKSIATSGAFNAGTLTILCMNDDAGADAAVGLKDRGGTAISDTTAAFHGIPEQPQWIFPSATAATSIVVTAYYERLC